MLDQKFHPEEGVTVQFEAKYASGQTCSGAYLKFYSDSSDFKPENMRGDTPYTIMFGPDVCGSTSKVKCKARGSPSILALGAFDFESQKSQNG